MTSFDRFRLRRRMLEFGLASLAWPTLARNARAAVEYPVVRTGTELVFPRDYGAHPQFRVEWWYVTGWLGPPRAGDPAFTGGTSRDPRAYGFQVTFFRVRPGIAENNPSHFAPKQLLFAHTAIADPALGRLRTAQRGAREGFGLAGAHAGTTQVWIDRWSLTRTGSGYRAIVGASDFAFDLELASTQPLLLEGDAGVSRKGPDPGDASFYY
ncbi:MAG: lipocalin-like domain-containing protein, partial [Casimicrobiaceae bacterium]